MMKRVNIALLLLVGVLSTASAQEKKWEHSVNLSTGLFLDGTTLSYDGGLSARLGYGVAYRLAERFSVKSGVAYRVDMESPIKAFTYANLSVYSVFAMIGGMVLPFVYGIMCGEEFKLIRVVCCVLIAICVTMSINKSEHSGRAIKYYMAVFFLKLHHAGM